MKTMLGFGSAAGLGFALLAAACGGSTGGGEVGSFDSGALADGGVDAVAPVDASTDAATGDASARDGSATDSGALDSGDDAALGAHAAQPQVVFLGGTVLTTPKVLLIDYANDPLATQVDDAVTELATMSTWGIQTSEYGVGALTKLPTIQIPGALPATISDDGNGVTPLQQTLIDNTTGSSPAWGAADASTIYAFLIPSETTFSGGGACCTDFYGYHYEVSAGGTEVSYAIICECTSNPGPTQIENTTTTVSHELVESATDPFPNTDPAYARTDNDDFIWTEATGGEVADMCEFNADQNYLPPGATYMVQRSWSNAAAAAGTNPCVPGASVPYFDSMPVLSDTISLTAYGQQVTTKGVTIPVGSSKTIDVQLFSSAATSGPWTVTAYDYNAFVNGGTANTTLTLDTNTGSNGDVIHLTIQVNSANADLGGEGFILLSDLGTAENISMGAIAN